MKTELGISDEIRLQEDVPVASSISAARNSWLLPSTVVGQIHFVGQIDFSRKFSATVKSVGGSVISEVRFTSPGKSVMSF